jgi:hypothetical protein
VLDTYARNPARRLACADPLSSIVIDLFDVQGWTREQIADWLEPIEAEYARQQAAAQEVVTA